MLPALVAAVVAAALGFLLFGLAGRDERTVLPAAWRVPVILVSGLLAGAGTAATELLAEVPLVVALAAFGTVLAAIDARSKLLPNAVLVRFLALTVLLLLVGAAITGQWIGLAGAAAGAGALFAVYLLLALISPAGMGMGDVKLAAVLGLYGGWAGAAAWMGTLLGGFLLGGLAGVAVLAARRGSRGSTFPFGPGMLAAAFASFVLLG